MANKDPFDRKTVSNEKKLKELGAPKSFKEKFTDWKNNTIDWWKRGKESRKSAVSKIKPSYLLAALAAVCVALIILSSVSDITAKPFKAIASAVVVPAQNGINQVGKWISDKLESISNMKDLAAENEELRKQINELTVTNTQLRQQESELKRLKTLLELKSEYSDYEMVAAQVVAKDSGKWFSTFTINKGTNDGLEKDMNVIANGGLVGIISDVGPNFATVTSIIDDTSSVSGKFQSNNEICMVNGNLTLMEDNVIAFSEVDADVEIADNDAVVTSQISSKFLPNILIGYVTYKETDANELTQSGYITPVVDFSNLDEVLVIKELKETSDE